MRSIIASLMITTLWMLVSCESEKTSAQFMRNEAKNLLMKLAIHQERLYRRTEGYSDDMTQLEFATDPFVSESGRYTIDIDPGADSRYYSATATYNGTDAEANECLWFKIDSHGNKTSAPESDCWRR